MQGPNGSGTILEVTKTSILYHFENGAKVISEGHLRVHFTPDHAIELLEFNTQSFAEYIPRDLFRSEEEQVISVPESPVNEFGISVRTMRCLEVLRLFQLFTHWFRLLKSCTLWTI